MICARTGAVGASGVGAGVQNSLRLSLGLRGPGSLECDSCGDAVLGLRDRGCSRRLEPRWTQSWRPGSWDRPGGWAWAEGVADSAVWRGQTVWEGSVLGQAPWLRLRVPALGVLWNGARWQSGQGQRWPAKQRHAVGGEAGCVDCEGHLGGVSFCVGLRVCGTMRTREARTFRSAGLSWAQLNVCGVCGRRGTALQERLPAREGAHT